MLEMVVPDQVILGEMASLHCLYDMEGEELYSVKWYKNGKEFYRLEALAKWAEFMKISDSLAGFITFNPLQLSPGQG